jgi:hypothetical protein
MHLKVRPAPKRERRRRQRRRQRRLGLRCRLAALRLGRRRARPTEVEDLEDLIAAW